MSNQITEQQLKEMANYMPVAHREAICKKDPGTWNPTEWLQAYVLEYEDMDMVLKEKFNILAYGIRYSHILNRVLHAIQIGVLQRDPKNSSHILVYRQASETSPEGWYSDNIIKVCMEMTFNLQNYHEFEKALSKVE